MLLAAIFVRKNAKTYSDRGMQMMFSCVDRGEQRRQTRGDDNGEQFRQRMPVDEMPSSSVRDRPAKTDKYCVLLIGPSSRRSSTSSSRPGLEQRLFLR